MQRNRIVVLAALVLGIVFLFGQPTIVTAAMGGGAKMGKMLNLTADQKAHIKAIRADAKSQIAPVSADQSMTTDAKQAKIKAIHQATWAQIKQVLTPVQQEKAMKAKRAARIAKLLDLTAGQKTQMKAIRADAKSQIAAVNADQSQNADAKKAKIKAIHQAEMAQVRQILTPEQQAKLDAARAHKGKCK